MRTTDLQQKINTCYLNKLYDFVSKPCSSVVNPVPQFRCCFRETPEALQAVEDRLLRKAVLLQYFMHLLDIRVLCWAAAAPTAEPAVRAPGVTAGARYRTEAGFSEIEETGVLIGLAFHADRILGKHNGFPEHEVRDDFFHLFFFYGASENSEVHGYERFERSGFIVRLDRVISIDLFFNPCRVFEPVLELVHPAEAGAGTERNEHLGSAPDILEPFFFVNAGHASFDKSDGVIVVLFGHGFPKIDNLDEGQEIEERGLVVHDLELASLAGRQFKECDLRPRRGNAEKGPGHRIPLFHQIASFRFITVQ